MDIQSVIAGIVIAAALGYVGLLGWRRIRSFTPKPNCGNDCGCNGGSKKLTS